jgi:hypothetical protein
VCIGPDGVEWFPGKEEARTAALYEERILSWSSEGGKQHGDSRNDPSAAARDFGNQHVK